jgi:hypothetical protein
MPGASAQRAIVVAPSSPHAPLVSGPSPDPFAPTLERGWRSSAGRKRRALYTQDQVRRQLSAKPCQILPKGVVPDYGLAGPRYRVIGCAAGPVGDLLDVVDRSCRVRPEGTVRPITSVLNRPIVDSARALLWRRRRCRLTRRRPPGGEFRRTQWRTADPPARSDSSHRVWVGEGWVPRGRVGPEQPRVTRWNVSVSAPPGGFESACVLQSRDQGFRAIG